MLYFLKIAAFIHKKPDLCKPGQTLYDKGTFMKIKIVIYQGATIDFTI